VTAGSDSRNFSALRIAALLPHLGLYGGNLRYLVIGNALAERGIALTLATPDGKPPAYFDYRGPMATLDELRASPPDVLLASEQNLFDLFRSMKAGRHVFYFILEKTAREREIARSGVQLLANSSGLARRLRMLYGAEAAAVVGGVNPRTFFPLEPKERELRVPQSFRIVANGRFSRPRKGSRIVAKAAGGLKPARNIELVYFDTTTVDHTAGLPEKLEVRPKIRLDLDVPREKLRIVYGSGDVFVSAEKKAGWSNPTIEAMACGVAVVCTSSGTSDFAIHEQTALVVPRTSWHVRHALARLMRDEPLRARIAQAGLAKAREFSWEATAERLLQEITRESDRAAPQ
jgi:glycosyltransferase involved in cell wall biosynthesis